MSKLTSNEIKEVAVREMFTDAEWSERCRHISTLRNFAGASISAGKALTEIREKKLYRPYSSLKEFCEHECGWTKQRAYQLIAAAKMQQSLPAKSQPRLTSERALRELAKVPEDKRVEVIIEAERNIPVSESLTSGSIKAAATKIQSVNGITDDMGFPVSDEALPCWNRKPEVSGILQHISVARSILGKVPDDDPLYRNASKIQTIVEWLDKAYNTLKGALPAYVCPKCNGIGVSKCESCGKTGVVSAYVWKQLLPEHKRRREEAILRIKANHPF